MPRTRPDGTTEHRITLGSYEREMVSDLIESANEDRDLAMIVDVTKSLAQPVAILGAGYLFYLGITNWGTAIDVLRDRWTAYVSKSKAAKAVEDVVTSDVFTVDQEGGGVTGGVYGGSVFM